MADASPSSGASGFASPLLAVIGLAALAMPFLVSGALKLIAFSGAVAEVRALTGADKNISPMLAALVIAVQLIGSIMLLSGRRWAVTGGAALLAGFTIIATFVAHSWWTREGAERARDIAAFTEHVAICGGLALAVVLVWRR